ncbi:hypothetical protein PhCBS80983_g06378 [Powellomyces hirtus]|uniref:Chromo domain-containing protein n=1 Tax=Powellomyces hirtus TaxID=109895 RepID=A0A507DPA3_9FUNG|nr:hypothetical protein PhCBS80983_g06378 [Powellomyces hirtus]
MTKWVEAFAVPDITANRVSRRLVEDVFCRFGIPGSIVTDRGQSFISNLQRQILSLLGTHPAFTSPYHPEADGLTERFNGTLVRMLQTYVNKYSHDDWDTQLPYNLLAYRTAMHHSTHESPFFLMFGRDPRLPKDLLHQTNTPTNNLEEAPTSIEMCDYRVETQLRLQKAWALARQNIKNAQKTQKTWYDRVSHMKDYGFCIGDKVWLAVPQFTKSARKENETAVEKMAVKWTGPHRIISCNVPTFKLLETLSPTEVILHHAHVRRLRYWTERRPVDSEKNPSLTQQEILEEELKLAERANKLTRKPFRPKAYGTLQELTRHGNDPDEDSDHEIDGIEREDAYEVEKIVNHRDTNDGREFLVKWKYWPAKHNTWETRENLRRAPDAVQTYKMTVARPVPARKPRG